MYRTHNNYFILININVFTIKKFKKISNINYILYIIFYPFSHYIVDSYFSIKINEVIRIVNIISTTI